MGYYLNWIAQTKLIGVYVMDAIGWCVYYGRESMVCILWTRLDGIYVLDAIDWDISRDAINCVSTNIPSNF
jgi:hypothetical protein